MSRARRQKIAEQIPSPTGDPLQAVTTQETPSEITGGPTTREHERLEILGAILYSSLGGSATVAESDPGTLNISLGETNWQVMLKDGRITLKGFPSAPGLEQFVGKVGEETAEKDIITTAKSAAQMIQETQDEQTSTEPVFYQGASPTNVPEEEIESPETIPLDDGMLPNPPGMGPPASPGPVSPALPTQPPPIPGIQPGATPVAPPPLPTAAKKKKTAGNLSQRYEEALKDLTEERFLDDLTDEELLELWGQHPEDAKIKHWYVSRGAVLSTRRSKIARKIIADPLPDYKESVQEAVDEIEEEHYESEEDSYHEVRDELKELNRKASQPAQNTLKSIANRAYEAGLKDGFENSKLKVGQFGPHQQLYRKGYQEGQNKLRQKEGYKYTYKEPR